jgi:hypothetical protein
MQHLLHPLLLLLITTSVTAPDCLLLPLLLTCPSHSLHGACMLRV